MRVNSGRAKLPLSSWKGIYSDFQGRILSGEPPRRATRLDRLSFLGMRAMFTAVSIFSRSEMHAFSRSMGTLTFRLMRKRREIALDNLRHAFPEKTEQERLEMAECCFRNVGTSIMELLWSRRVTRNTILEYLECSEESLGWCRKALALGKGYIAIPIHLGNWELGSVGFGYYGLPVHIVVKPLRNPLLDNFVNRTRCRLGTGVLLMGSATKLIRKLLAHNRGVAIFVDQKVPMRNGGVLVDFFGRPAATSPLPARLALHTGAPILPAICYPLPQGRAKLQLGPWIEFEPTGNRRLDHLELTQRIVKTVEDLIRVDPAYWLWGHKRWKI